MTRLRATLARRRLTPVACTVALSALVLAAVGCGGGGAGGSSAAPGGKLTGTVSVLGPWSGRDQQSFETVAHEFMLANPGVKVKYESAGEQLPRRLAAAVERGTPPDVSVVGGPRILRELADKDELSSLDYMKDYVADNLGGSTVALGSVDGTLYGVLFKVFNNSTVWFNPFVFRDAGLAPPRTWRELTATAAALEDYGMPAFSLGVADGEALAVLFDNIYLRQAGPEQYDRLAAHEIPWTDESVKTALRTMAQLFAGRSNVAGNPLEIDYSESVSNVFKESPEAAMVFGGDSVPTVVDPPNPVPVFYGRQPGIDYDVFTFPSINGSAPMVVGGADTMVSFDDGPATKAFMEYLTSPEAAQIWLKRGWFATLNRDATLERYAFPDPITRATAGAIGEAQAFRFGLASLQPRAFGGGEGMSKLLRGLLERRAGVDTVAERLEDAARKAYG